MGNLAHCLLASHGYASFYIPPHIQKIRRNTTRYDAFSSRFDAPYRNCIKGQDTAIMVKSMCYGNHPAYVGSAGANWI